MQPIFKFLIAFAIVAILTFIVAYIEGLKNFHERFSKLRDVNALHYYYGTGPQGDWSLHGYAPGPTKIRRAPVGGVIVSTIQADSRHMYGNPPESCDLCPSCYVCPECPKCN